MLLTIDIGGTSVKSGLFDRGHLTPLESFDTPKDLETFLSKVGRLVQGQKAHHQLHGLAVSSPGAVDSQKGQVGGISAVPYIHGIPLVELLEDVSGLPVSIENDANCAILSEVYRGEAYHYDHTVFLVVGTGIGGGYVVNQKLVKGKNNASGEFGSMRLFDRADNWSSRASTLAMVRAYQAATGQMFDGRQIFDLADKGDQTASAHVTQFYQNLAKGIYNLLMAYDPEIIFIGGGISSRPTLIQELRPHIQALLDLEGLKDFRFDLRLCHFSDQANLIGAAVHFQNRYPDLA
ncbi:TPA: ROK family protein [Streptococcus suis]